MEQIQKEKERKRKLYQKQEIKVLKNTENTGPYFNIKLSRPVRMSQGRSHWTTYGVDFRITKTGYSGHTERRYSDFSWLRNMMVTEAPQFIVPVVPAKGKDRFNETMIERRRRAMEKFLTTIADHPVLAWTESFRLFFTVDDTTKTSELVKCKLGNVGEDEAENSNGKLKKSNSNSDSGSDSDSNDKEKKKQEKKVVAKSGENNSFQKAFNKFLENNQEMDPEMLDEKQKSLNEFEKDTEKLSNNINSMIDVKEEHGSLYCGMPNLIHTVISNIEEEESESSLWSSFGQAVSVISDLFIEKGNQEKEVIGDAFSEFLRQSHALKEPFACYSNLSKKKKGNPGI